MNTNIYYKNNPQLLLYEHEDCMNFQKGVLQTNGMSGKGGVGNQEYLTSNILICLIFHKHKLLQKWNVELSGCGASKTNPNKLTFIDVFLEIINYSQETLTTLFLYKQSIYKQPAPRT